MNKRTKCAIPCALAIAVTTVSACEGDPSSAPLPGAIDASFDAQPPDAPDGPDALDAGLEAIDPSKIAWQRLLPDLPADGVRAGSECDVAVDADDRVLVTYGESADGYMPPRSLSVFRHDGSAWTTLGGALVSASDSFVVWPRLAVAKDGSVYVAYTHQGAVVQRFRGGTWVALPPSGFDGLRGIAVDAAGLPVVIGRVGSSPAAIARFDGAAWSAPTTPLTDVDAGGGLERGVLSIAGRPDGTIAAVVRSATRLQGFVLSGTSAWSSLGADFADGEFPEISSSPNGRLGAAWSAGNNVYAARFDPSAQAFVPLGGPLGQAGARYAVAAIDPFDRPIVAWREQQARVAVSVFAGGAWQALPDPLATRGTLPAIALDRRGLPVVCWEAGREAGTASAIGVARGVVP